MATWKSCGFRCAKCRLKSKSARKGKRYEPTGRMRRLPQGHLSRESAGRLMQYRCFDCGHIGWSKHRDVEMAFHRQQLGFRELAPADKAW